MMKIEDREKEKNRYVFTQPIRQGLDVTSDHFWMQYNWFEYGVFLLLD